MLAPQGKSLILVPLLTLFILVALACESSEPEDYGLELSNDMAGEAAREVDSVLNKMLPRHRTVGRDDSPHDVVDEICDDLFNSGESSKRELWYQASLKLLIETALDKDLRSGEYYKEGEFLRFADDFCAVWYSIAKDGNRLPR